jgi:hypothetical protein
MHVSRVATMRPRPLSYDAVRYDTALRLMCCRGATTYGGRPHQSSLRDLRHPHLVEPLRSVLPGAAEPVTVPRRRRWSRSTGRRAPHGQLIWSLDAGADLDVDVRVLPWGLPAGGAEGHPVRGGWSKPSPVGWFRSSPCLAHRRGRPVELADRWPYATSGFAPCASGRRGVTIAATLVDNGPVVTVLPHRDPSGRHRHRCRIPTRAPDLRPDRDSATKLTLTGPPIEHHRPALVPERHRHLDRPDDLATGMLVGAATYPAGTVIPVSTRPPRSV